MIVERLSEGARKELEALTNQERQKLIYEMWQTDPVDRDFLLAWLDRIEKNPPLDPDVDVVALIREGRR